MNDYGRDRYLEETPAESAARERALALAARAQTLADVMIDNQSECDVTGVRMDDVVGTLSDERLAEYTELTFACAAGSTSAPRLLRALLREQAAKLIRDELEAIGCRDVAPSRIVQHRAAWLWGERP